MDRRVLRSNGMPLKVTESLSGRPGCIENSIVGGSVVVAGGYVRNSILGNNVFIGPDAEVKDSVILGNTVIEEEARVLRAVIDHGNVVAKKEDIGFDRESDAVRFFLDGSGIVVLPHRHDDLFYLNLTKGD